MRWQELALFVGSVLEIQLAYCATNLSRRLFINLKIVRKENLGSMLAWTYLLINLAAIHHLITAGLNANLNFYFLAGNLMVDLGIIANQFVTLQNRGRMPVDYNFFPVHEWTLISTREHKIKIKGSPDEAIVATEALNNKLGGLEYYECHRNEKDRRHILMLPSVRYHWLCDIIQNKIGISSIGDQLMILGLIITFMGVGILVIQARHSL